MYSTKSKNKKNSRNIQILIGGLLLVAAVLFILERTGVTNFYEREQAEVPTAATPTPTINLDPPTEEEASAGDARKDVIVNEGQPELPNTASVVIVDASQYDAQVEVRAFVSNIIEDGMCTFTFSKDSQSFQKTTQALGDATTTLCTSLAVPTAEFTSGGTWDVNVAYANDTVAGNASATVEVSL